MQQVNIPLFPIKLQLDSAHEKLRDIESRFLKNTRLLQNANPNNVNQSGNNIDLGGNAGNITPVLSNKLLDASFELPAGNNKTIGGFECRELNEFYWFVWNENQQHTINVIDGFTELCTTVYQGECLNFSLDPKHAIPEHKVWLTVTYDSKLVNNENIKIVKEKELQFTDGLNNVRQLNVLASVGSEFFTTAYFNPVYPHYDACCDYITLAPIAPMYCPQVELIDRVEGADGHAVDKELPNNFFENPLQIAYNFGYIDNRPSSVSPYSDPIIVGGTDCADQNPETLPRCANVRLWAGNAFVNLINIYYRKASIINSEGIVVAGDWVLYDTIFKHNCPDEDVKWWDRTGAWDDFDYDVNDNTIEYEFCANKQCTPVDQALFEHIENLVPFAAVALTPAGSNLLLANCLVGSDNLTCEQTECFEITVTDQENTVCNIPTRSITIYMIARNDSDDRQGHGNENQFFFGDIKGGTNIPIDGKFYIGGFGWREHPVTGTMKVAIDGYKNNDFWKLYDQYVPADINGVVGGFVGYLEGTSFVSISTQVKYYAGDCNVEEVGIIYRELATMYNTNGSFDDIVEALKDGEYVFLQKFVFEDVPAGKYVFRIGGENAGMETGYEQTSTTVYGYENIGACDSDEVVTPAIKDTPQEWIIDVCENDYDSLVEGYAMLWLDGTYPDFEQDAGNVLDYNFIRKMYLFEDADESIPFEKQQISFEYGEFTEKLTGTKVTVDGFEVSGTPLYLIDPLTVNVLGIGFPIPCPPAPLLPLAGMLDTPSGIVPDTLRKTDHNGFVFHREHFWRWRIYYNVLFCSPVDMTATFGEPTLGTFSVTYTSECGTESDDVQIGINKVQPPVTALNNKGYRGLLGTVSHSTNTDDQPCNRTLIKGKLLDQNGNPLVGISVGYSGSKFVLTDGFGSFSVIAHQNLSFDRNDYFMISNSGSACTIVCTDSEDCTLCCTETFVHDALPACVDCEESIIEKGTMVFKKVNFTDKGLRGRYGIGIVLWDCYGRIVSGGVNLLTYVDTPQCWEIHPILSWAWNGGVLLPQEAKYMSFFITKNLNGTVLQWVADSFDLLDENGNITTSKGNASAVAVNLKSLLQYNLINNFNTLISYGFVKGDVLNIIEDCENPITFRITGTTFGTPNETALESELTVTAGDTTATSKTNFATDNGSTVIIPYDGQIDAFLDKCAVKIEINRPYSCENNLNPFYELCGMYPIIDGVPLVDSTSGGGSSEEIGGVLNAFDTYKIFRNIPKIVDCAQNPNDDPYFSNNITDFWGQAVGSFGRIGSENPYAQRIWEENRVMRSLARVNNGIVNGLATFWGENTKDYDTQNFGGIQAMFAFRNLIGFICTQDFFLADYKVPYLYNDGQQIKVTTLNQNLGEPHSKIGMTFGCMQEDTSTIVYNEGMASYYSKTEYITTNFQTATDISIDGIKSWLIAKANHIQNFNQALPDNILKLYYMFEVVCGYDYMFDEIVITLRPRNNLSTNANSFVNLNRDTRIAVGETIVYNSALKTWVNFRGYVPEYYGKLKDAGSGRQMYSFKNGIPYSHNNKTGTFNTFFGVKVPSVLEPCINNTDSKVKIYLSHTQEILPQCLFIDRIITEERNSYSYLPLAWMVRKENIYYGAFLRDMASYWDANYMHVSVYIEGKRIFGKFAFMRFVSTLDDADKYFALNHLWFLVTGSELSMKPQISSPNQNQG